MMPGLFQGLEIGKRALLSHQITLQTIGHNIANVDTPGYSRQRVRITATSPERLSYGSVGTGIRVDDIRHIRDLFLGEQYRQANKDLGKWTYKERTLTQVESIFNEPQDNSLNDMLNQFWDAWSDLSANSDSSSSREMVLAKARQLINSFHQLSRQLTALRDSVNDDLNNMTAKVNRLTTEIAGLNQQIKTTELGGNKANDLRDARDRLTDELANLIDVNTREKDNGATVVYMGGMVLVDGSDSIDIGSVAKNKNGVSTNLVVWKGTEIPLTNLSGQLAGLTESRDKTIPDYMNKLNAIAEAVVKQVNAIHRNGYGFDRSTNGLNFFDPNFTDAATIRLNQDLEQDINKVAASSSADGDNLIALQLSGLRNMTILADNTQTVENYYHSIIGGLGIDTSEATSFRGNLDLLRQQTENARQSVQGVSLDEEMADMVKYQHAYDAAARVITTMDQALDTVIRGMGIVGR